MAESASGQDGANPAFWLATLAGKMGHLGISCVVPARKKFLFGHTINALLTKHVRSRRLDIGRVPFCVFIDQDEVGFKKRKKELGEYSATLISSLVNNSYVTVIPFAFHSSA